MKLSQLNDTAARTAMFADFPVCFGRFIAWRSAHCVPFLTPHDLETTKPMRAERLQHTIAATHHEASFQYNLNAKNNIETRYNDNSRGINICVRALNLASDEISKYLHILPQYSLNMFECVTLGYIRVNKYYSLCLLLTCRIGTFCLP